MSFYSFSVYRYIFIILYIYCVPHPVVLVVQQYQSHGCRPEMYIFTLSRLPVFKKKNQYVLSVSEFTRLLVPKLHTHRTRMQLQIYHINHKKNSKSCITFRLRYVALCFQQICLYQNVNTQYEECNIYNKIGLHIYFESIGLTS